MVEKVYVIDDDKMVLFIQEKMLNASQFCTSILKFDEAQDALEELKNEKAKELILFLDINMPYMSGWEFLKKIENIETQTKINVIMVTSSINPEDEEVARSKSLVIDFLIKPVKIDHLNQLKKHEAIQHLF